MVGVIVVNTGSPDSYNPRDVGRYLAEFLMDERVIDIPLWQRFLLVKGIIVPFRKYKSAKSYQKIWGDNGSPLLTNTTEQARLLEMALDTPVEVAMRYGNPTVEHASLRLVSRASKLSKVVVVPMFPHYAMSSYESVLNHAVGEVKRVLPSVKVGWVEPYYSKAGYIAALADKFSNVNLEQYDWLQLSYHSIPLRHQSKSLASIGKQDFRKASYSYQVEQTSLLLAQKLGMDTRFGVSYQSSLGSKWLGPSTSEVLSELPKKGVRRLLIASPAFVADNLETIKDIGEEARAVFIESGGEELCYVPCLNDSKLFAEFLSDEVKQLYED